ncbi:unnamed protein product [Rotaria sp. Silwood1]|nr:unnamed protein product [Rotaria sp. Silwood1]
MEISTMTQTTVGLSTMATFTMAPSTMATSTMAPSTMATSTMAPSTMATSTMAPSTMATSTMAPSTMATSTMATSTMVPSTMATSTMAPSTMTTFTMAPSTMATSTIAPSTMATSTMAPSTMTTFTMVPSTMATSTKVSSTMASSTAMLSTMALSTTASSTTVLSTAMLSRMATSTIVPSTMTSSTARLLTMAASITALSTMTPLTTASSMAVPFTVAPSTMMLSTMATSAKIVSTIAPCTAVPSTVASSVMTPSTIALSMLEISTATSMTSFIIEGCSSPIITLTPSNPQSCMPWYNQRSQSLSISSIIQLNCPKSLLTRIQWTIYACRPLCSFQIEIDPSVAIMTLSELFLPSRSLHYGIYMVKLTVTMQVLPQLTSSEVTYISIIPSPITVNLIRFGSSMISIGRNQTLILDPGSFSIDPDEVIFDANNWNYSYYCRIGSQLNFMPIDSPFCFGNRSECYYGSNGIRSSLIIQPGLLQINQTYQFRADLINALNASRIFTGYVLVKVEENDSMIISISCVISEICLLVDEYHLINPTTQLALTSLWLNSEVNQSFNGLITWNIYQGSMNTTMQWTLLPNIRTYAYNWFFGIDSENFTATKDLFINYPSVKYWRFEVIYSMDSIHGIGAIDFMINSPPENGTCSISPHNGTTTTLFTIICENWIDANGVRDYSFYTWTTNSSAFAILGYTIIPTIQVLLPANGNDKTMIHVIARIRDMYGCMTEIDLPTVSIVFDMATTNNLINDVVTIPINLVNNTQLNSNPIVIMLAGGNQNRVSQVLIAQVQALNAMSLKIFQTAVAGNISAVTISVTSLNDERQVPSSSTVNISTMVEYSQQWNHLAEVRDYLISFVTNLMITTIDSIILQSSMLAQLTEITSQLTRDTALLASTRCNELANKLHNIASTTDYDNIKLVVDSIHRCASNTFQAINLVLNERGIVLDIDRKRANILPVDYDTDLELSWSNFKLIIPRDPNLSVPPMALQNIASASSSGNLTNNQQFNLHFINATLPTSNISKSVHFEMLPDDQTRGYMIIYRFDTVPQLNSSINQTDGWFLFCPSNLNNEGLWITFIDNQQMSNHQSVIFGVRELNQTEFDMYCFNETLNLPPITDQPYNFTANYSLRIFISGCYYRDSNDQWQSDGLNVQFNLVGAEDETGTRTLIDPNREILQRGFVDSFIIAVPSSLGALQYIHIWHDNSSQGRSASWFLKYVIVCNLQTMEKTYFICQNWLAIDKDDGMIERYLPTAGELQTHDIAYIFAKKAYYNMSDEHLWFSIFSRPPASHFTRVQRCTCCFLLLFTAMLLGILYYDQAQQAKNTISGGFHLGPLYITREQVSTVADYWQWLQNSFVSNIRAQQWYNGDPPRNLNGFINDKNNRLIGWVVMRQLRVRPEYDCRIPDMFRGTVRWCSSDYKIWTADRRLFQPGWTLNASNISYSQSIENAFKYRSSNEIDSYSHMTDHAFYDGGGYIYEFRGRLNDIKKNLTVLQQLSWIDRLTRAIFIQFSLYNPNAELFTSAIITVEFLVTSGLISSSRFDPFRFHNNLKGFSSVFHLICATIYLVLIIYLTLTEIQSLIRKKQAYFRVFWSYIEWSIIGCSWASVALVIWRYREMSRIGILFHKTNGMQYLNLELVASVDNYLTCLLGLCCYLAMIKLIGFFRFNRRLSVFNRTLQYAAKDLLYFSLQFSIIAFAFIALFYLLFTAAVQSCSTLLLTTQMFIEEHDVQTHLEYEEQVHRFPERIDQLLAALERVGSY